MSALSLYLGALGVGIPWALWFLPRSEVKPGYTAWMAATSFTVLVALLVLRWRTGGGVDPADAATAAGALAFRLLPLPVVHLAASLLGGALLFRTADGSWMPFLSVALSALVLGTVLDAMVLGHWYLVQHGLSFRPLEVMAVAVVGVVAARLALSAAGYLLAGGWAMIVGQRMDRLVFFLMRVLLGFVGPLGLGWMVRECVRIKSNTSATGILYVVTVFVLVGEFISVWFVTEGVCL